MYANEPMGTNVLYMQKSNVPKAQRTALSTRGVLAFVVITSETGMLLPSSVQLPIPMLSEN